MAPGSPPARVRTATALRPSSEARRAFAAHYLPGHGNPRGPPHSGSTLLASLDAPLDPVSVPFAAAAARSRTCDMSSSIDKGRQANPLFTTRPAAARPWTAPLPPAYAVLLGSTASRRRPYCLS